MGGHAKCLLLMTRSKNPKTCLFNTWMFPIQIANKHPNFNNNFDIQRKLERNMR